MAVSRRMPRAIKIAPSPTGTADAVDASAADVIHLVGRGTDSVFSFLGPATAALALRDVRQTVILIDDPSCRHVLPKFHHSVRLVLTRFRRSASARMGELLRAFVATARPRRAVVAHLHGLTPMLVGLYAARYCGIAVRMYFSPHGSKLLGPLRIVGAPLLRSLRSMHRQHLERAIVSTRADARSLRRIMRHAVDVVESPVGEAFFASSLEACATPLVVMSGGGADSPAATARFAQCAVLFSNQVPGLRFEWIGSAGAASATMFKAAAVPVHGSDDDEDRASRMASAWVCLALDESAGFPVRLAEAMALGLPCIAWDTPDHRDLVVDQECGFLCRSQESVMSRLTELLASRSLRHRIGENARAAASERFDVGRFRTSLLDAYGALPPAAAHE